METMTTAPALTPAELHGNTLSPLATQVDAYDFALATLSAEYSESTLGNLAAALEALRTGWRTGDSMSYSAAREGLAYRTAPHALGRQSILCFHRAWEAEVAARWSRAR